MYIAPDDYNYFAYFEGAATLRADDWWLFIIEEPLWIGYVNALGTSIGGESAIRATLFGSTLAFLYFASRLATNDQNGTSAWLWVVLIFVLDNALATQMYFNQIRQGLALSVFLGLMWWARSSFTGAAVAATIHSSFLIVLPAAVGVRLTAGRRVAYALLLVGAVAVIYLIGLGSDSVDLGRRTEDYEGAGRLNASFYVLAALQYGVLLYSLGIKRLDVAGVFWAKLALMCAAIAVTVTTFHEAGGRLLYHSSAFAGIALIQGAIYKRGIVALLMWVGFLAFRALNEGLNMSFDASTVFGRWLLIFESWGL